MTEIRNPVKLPTDLNSAEKKFVRCLTQGDPCVLGDAVPKDHDNTIREEVIRFFVYGGDEENPVLGTRIFLQGARVSGCLDLTHMEIPYALIFRKCRFDHAVNMRHAECRELDLQGSHLQGGLAGNPLRTKGGVRLSEGFVAKDGVLLSSARIGGVLDCSDGKFCKGLSANKAKMEVLIWRAVAGRGEVQLKAANADVLDDDLDSWRSFKVDLDGFTYDQFVNLADAQFRIGWLAKRPKGVKFSPLPYEQAAKVLFGKGHVQDARKILLAKERQQTKDGRMRWLWKLGRILWDVFAGYGYRLRYTARWMMGIVIFGTVVFGVADYHGNIVPTHPVVALSEDYRGKIAPNGNLRPTQAVKPEYPAFNPFMFSLDVFTPSAVFHQEDSWGPRSGRESWWTLPLLVLAFLWMALALCFSWFAVIVLLSRLGCIKKRKKGLLCGCGLGAGVIVVITGMVFLQAGYLNVLWLLTLWYWFEVAMGWILTPMLLLSITGLLRPRQSSSEKD